MSLIQVVFIALVIVAAVITCKEKKDL